MLGQSRRNATNWGGTCASPVDKCSSAWRMAWEGAGETLGGLGLQVKPIFEKAFGLPFEEAEWQTAMLQKLDQMDTSRSDCRPADPSTGSLPSSGHAPPKRDPGRD